jgi:hypothetical protein
MRSVGSRAVFGGFSLPASAADGWWIDQILAPKRSNSKRE